MGNLFRDLPTQVLEKKLFKLNQQHKHINANILPIILVQLYRELLEKNNHLKIYLKIIFKVDISF
jgi:hypothetical protein